eukprot:gene3950-7160_t
MFVDQDEDNKKYLKEKIKKRNELKKLIKQPSNFDLKKTISKLVYFNVGGKIFNCYLFTLLKHDSILRVLFSGQQLLNTDVLNDKNEMIFVDRPSKPFEIILNCIRTNTMYIEEESDLGCSQKLLENEIKFYGLKNKIQFKKRIVPIYPKKKNNRVPPMKMNNFGGGIPPILNPINRVMPNVGSWKSKLFLQEFIRGISSALNIISTIMIIFYSFGLKYFQKTNHFFIPIFLQYLLQLNVSGIFFSWVLFKDPLIFLIKSDFNNMKMVGMLPLIWKKRISSSMKIKICSQMSIVIILLYFQNLILNHHYLFWIIFICNLIFILVGEIEKSSIFLFIDLWLYFFRIDGALKMTVELLYFSSSLEKTCKI